MGAGGGHHGRSGGRRRGHLLPEVWERLDDEVPELEKGADLILQLLQGHQRLGLLAYQIVKGTWPQGHAVHATAAGAVATAAADHALRRATAATLQHIERLKVSRRIGSFAPLDASQILTTFRYSYGRCTRLNVTDSSHSKVSRLPKQLIAFKSIRRVPLSAIPINPYFSRNFHLHQVRSGNLLASELIN